MTMSGWRYAWLGVALFLFGVPCFIGFASAASFECLIEPMQVVQLRSPVEGLIGSVDVKRGDEVRKGQKLVELQSDAERSAVEAARYRAEMKGRITAAQNRLSFAQKKLERWQNLVEQKFVSPQDRDQTETEKQLAEAELQQAMEDRQLARLEYQHALDRLDLRTLNSPFDGVVVERMLNPGDLAESGTDRKPILKLAQIDPLRVEVALPEETYGKLHVGMTGIVVPDVLGGRYQARVTVVDPVLDAASGTQGVRLELPNHDGKLPGGLRCQVEFPEWQTSATVAQAGPEVVAEPSEPSLPTATEQGPATAAAEPSAPPLPAEPVGQAEDRPPEASSVTAAQTTLNVVPENATLSLPPPVGDEAGIAAVPESVSTPLAESVDQVGDSRPGASSITEVQSELEVATEPAAPPLAPALRDEIDSLLGRIQVNIRRDRLSRPADDNAVNKINRIFELDAGNLAARAAMDNVIDRYITLARETRGSLGKTYLQAAHRLNPGRLDIDDAWDDLYAPEKSAWYAGN